MKKNTIDFCWGCGAPTLLRCHRCEKPVCVVWGSPTPAVGCATLRKSPRGVGVYLLVCSPSCRKRRSPMVLASMVKHMKPKWSKRAQCWLYPTVLDGRLTWVSVPESENNE